MYGASENDGVIALVCVLDTYYWGGGEMEEHIIKYISLDNNDIRLYSFDWFVLSYDWRAIAIGAIIASRLSKGQYL